MSRCGFRLLYFQIYVFRWSQANFFLFSTFNIQSTQMLGAHPLVLQKLFQKNEIQYLIHFFPRFKLCQNPLAIPLTNLRVLLNIPNLYQSIQKNIITPKLNCASFCIFIFLTSNLYLSSTVSYLISNHNIKLIKYLCP